MAEFDIQARFNALDTEVANEPTVPGGIAHFLAGLARMASDRGDPEFGEYINAHSGKLIANAFSNVEDNYGVKYSAQVDPDHWHRERVKKEETERRERDASKEESVTNRRAGGDGQDFTGPDKTKDGDINPNRMIDPGLGKQRDGDAIRAAKPANTRS